LLRLRQRAKRVQQLRLLEHLAGTLAASGVVLLVRMICSDTARMRASCSSLIACGEEREWHPHDLDPIRNACYVSGLVAQSRVSADGVVDVDTLRPASRRSERRMIAKAASASNGLQGHTDPSRPLGGEPYGPAGDSRRA